MIDLEKRKAYKKQWYEDHKKLHPRIPVTPEIQEERKIKYSEQKKEKYRKEIHIEMWRQARKRAERDNIPFNITPEFILSIWPEDNLCPVLGTPLQIANKRLDSNSPSLDKIIPELGYIKDNVMIICNRANIMKNCATPKELKKFIKFYSKQDFIKKA